MVFLLFTTTSRLALMLTQPLFDRYRKLLIQGLKRPQREADKSSPCRVEEYNLLRFVSVPQIVSHIMKLRYRGNFVLTFYLFVCLCIYA